MSGQSPGTPAGPGQPPHKTPQLRMLGPHPTPSGDMEEPGTLRRLWPHLFPSQAVSRPGLLPAPAPEPRPALCPAAIILLG